MRDVATPVNYGALYTYSTSARSNWASGTQDYSLSKGIGFNASKSSSVYGRYGYTNSEGSYVTGNTSYVTPRNYALNAYIYTGKRGTAGDPSKCNVGEFIYSDYTCSTTLNTSKTALGYVLLKNAESGALTVISGGNKTAASHQAAVTACQASGHDIALPFPLLGTYITQFINLPANNIIVPLLINNYYTTPLNTLAFYCTGTTSDACKTISVTASTPKYYYCQDTIM